MNNHNIGKAFEKLKKETFFVYSGLRFEKTQAGYVHNGILCRDLHEVDLLVEHERHALKNSIKTS